MDISAKESVQLDCPADLSKLYRRFSLEKPAESSSSALLNRSKKNDTTVNHVKEHSKIQGISGRHLVDLYDSESAIPVFCIHPSGGDVGIYRKLGRNLRKRTTIGIQSRMNFGLENEYSNVTQMAEAYATLINQHQPTGPIRLLGFSFGGFIANGIVSQLKELQRDVGFFGVIDSDLRWAIDKTAVRGDLSARLEQISINLQNAGLLNPIPLAKLKTDVEAIVDLCLDGLEGNLIAEDMKARGHTGRSDSGSIKFREFVVRFAAHCRMIQTFQPSPMEVPIHTWWPSEGDDQHQQRCQNWRDLALSHVFDSTVQGSHYSIMKMPCVKQIAAEISSVLAESENRLEQTINQP